MTTHTAATARIAHLDVPGARIHYELRGSGPLVVLHAAPMGAQTFTPLAELLAEDHTVLTSDPRGIGRSMVDLRERDVTPDVRADDLARLLVHVDAGQAIVLGSSGGAVSALALAQSRPELVRTVIAHEPPLAQLLEDCAELRARHDDLLATFLAGDRRGYWAGFLTMANIRLPEALIDALFGGELSGRDAEDEHFAVTRMDIPTTFWRPDLTALRAVGSRIVVGIGEQSAGQLCDRASRALAVELATQPEMFPGGHLGFADDPGAFAARLRPALGS